MKSGASKIPGARIVCSYSPASSHDEIGGDWYDVLPLSNDCVALTVGDVVGHDMRAAAVMGQLRNVISMSALEADGPADALARVDRFMVAAGIGDLTTVVQAHYDPIACNPLLRPGRASAPATHSRQRHS